ncbi:hypothetical protein GCM10017687_23710 [Streptomyces echinatus]
MKCVSFKELADWLDVQKPATLAALRTLDPAPVAGLVGGRQVTSQHGGFHLCNPLHNRHSGRAKMPLSRCVCTGVEGTSLKSRRLSRKRSRTGHNHRRGRLRGRRCGPGAQLERGARR